jgi:drug/metabolite transporter (DMT)-like permease
VVITIGPHLTFARGASAGVVIALTSAVFSAVAMAFLRSMAGREHVITITFYFSLTFMSCSALTSLQGWPMPTPAQWLLIVLAGFLGVGGQLLMTYAYRFAEASTIAPLDYSNMILAVALGWAFFDEIPTLSVWIGGSLIVAAGAIILGREYHLKKQLSTPSAQA